jgi:hypothetical protein
MSKFQTMDILKGNRTIDVNQYFSERWEKLEEFKNYFGDHTGTDEKFYNEKHLTLREQQDLFRSFAESLGFSGHDFNDLNIHISFSKKEKETE